MGILGQISRFRNGFTLVEISIAIGILAILASLSVVTLVSYGERQQFNQVLYELQNGLREAQSKSRAALNNTTHGVYVGTSTLEYFAGSVGVPGSAANQRVTVPAGITITPNLTGGVRQVVFARVTGTPSVTGTIVVTDTRSFTTATVTLSAGGLVQ